MQIASSSNISILLYLLRKMCYIILLVVCSITYAHAQSAPGVYKYGERNPNWIKATVFEKDTTAEAVILFAYGKCTVEPNHGTKLTIKRVIKILKKNAITEWGALSLTAVDSRLTDFSGVIYNFNDNLITAEKIDLDQVFRERDKSASHSKIAFPNVQAGSVIEYTYTIKSLSYGVFDWEFQHPIPVLYSEYEVFIPNSSIPITAVITGLYKLRVVSRQRGNLKNYSVSDLPAFKEEPFMPNPDWYRSSIGFRPFRNPKGETEMYWLRQLEENGLVRDTAMMDTKTLAQADFRIHANGSLSGTINLRWSGYEATLAREDIQASSEEEFLKSVYEGEQWVVNEQVLENAGNPDRDLTARYDLIIPDNIDVTDSLLYVNPYIALKEERNPFKLEERLYPVDLGSRLERTMVAHLTIPDGYAVDDVPKSSILQLPNKSALFTSSINHIGNKIYITSKLKFNKIIFNIDEYQALREFFLQVIEKKSRLIVLRKIK